MSASPSDSFVRRVQGVGPPPDEKALGEDSCCSQLPKGSYCQQKDSEVPSGQVAVAPMSWLRVV
jgi:hypothetical protein